MPNKKQRMQNRANAAELRRHILSQHVCEECGEKGAHWVVMPSTLAELLVGAPEGGFWVCPKFYGPDGRRIGLQEGEVVKAYFAGIAGGFLLLGMSIFQPAQFRVVVKVGFEGERQRAADARKRGYLTKLRSNRGAQEKGQ